MKKILIINSNYYKSISKDLVKNAVSKLSSIKCSINIINVPEIIKYDDDSKIMVMYKIGLHNLSDQYGENAKEVPNKLFDQVIKIVRTLVLHGIEYPDLTGYNFIEDDCGVVGIIDFEHSSLMTSSQVNNIHIQNICNGYKVWNPEFR